MFRKAMKSFSVAVLAGSTALSPALSQTNSGDPLWSSKPTRVDKTHQSLERLPAKPAPEQAEPDPEAYPLKLKRTLPFRVIDSVSFIHEGRKYRLAHLAGIPVAKTCTTEDGQRWACGLKSRVALAGLLRGKQIRCVQAGEKNGFALVECIRGNKDIGGHLAEAGYALAVGEHYRSQQDSAKQASAGVWGDPAALSN
jgi:endonuclease YncB( thermonuclease family)